ncbi:MAG: aromatic amino acid DMT transporter YddG [Chloroflexi bacterium]|nr:aromatic amino acid DMT transporter YddG [Chloroflexota bacterium]
MATAQTGVAPTSSRLSGNLMGILSIAIWSSVIAFSRSLAEELGTFTSGAGIYLAGGALSVGLMLLRHKGFAWVRAFSPRYLWICGGLFIFYEVCLYIAVGYAASRQQVLEVGLINYLWIGFTFAFAVPVLKKKARWTLIAGILMALAGVVTATLPPDYSLAELKTNLLQHGGPYACALACAVSWGLYSNLSRRWASDSGASAVPLFLLVTGLALLSIRLFVVEHPHLNASNILELVYLILFPVTLGYIFWDIAMRKGNLILIASLSYAIPLASTLISSSLLHVAVSANLWLACLLVIAGAVVCKYSLND